MGSTRKFKVYDISTLRGKVPSIFLDSYLDDTDNIELITSIAGLQLSCGNFDLGVKMSEDIVEKVNMESGDLKDISIAIWNLYILSKIYTEQEKFDKAYRMLDIAERYWTRDIMLVETGGYKVRNIEDLWLRRAFAYLCQDRKEDFEVIIDKVMLSVYGFYNKAYPITGETPIRDLCLLDCFEYSSYMYRDEDDLKRALIFIKTAVRYLGRIPKDNDYLEAKISERKGELKNAYNYYLKYYVANRPQQYYFSSTVYGTCKCCSYFETMDNCDGQCMKHNIKVDSHKACSKFLPLPLEEG